jgi:hypothetical protein
MPERGGESPTKNSKSAKRIICVFIALLVFSFIVFLDDLLAQTVRGESGTQEIRKGVAAIHASFLPS